MNSAWAEMYSWDIPNHSYSERVSQIHAYTESQLEWPNISNASTESQLYWPDISNAYTESQLHWPVISNAYTEQQF